jgi:hypothetical protein
MTAFLVGAPVLVGAQVAATGAQALSGCRADICTDSGDDCCAPGDEARGCREEGYVVQPGGSSSYAPCVSSFGASAVYQCCPSVCNHLPRLALCSGDSDSLDWHPSVHLPTPPAAAGQTTSQECTVLAQTDGGTCAAFCQAHDMQCMRGQNNALGYSTRCVLDHATGGGGGNGCFESFEDQMCTCQASQHADLSRPLDDQVTDGLAGCRADICTDSGDDCCAPGDEARGCREEGYVVQPGGSTSYTPCVPSFGASAVYQCCPNVRQDDISHLSCAQPGGAPVPSAAHARSDTIVRPGSRGVRLRRWQVPSDCGTEIIDAFDLVEVLADYDLTTEVMSEYFESPTNVCDQCLTELDAVFEAAVSGEYAFVVAADDDFRLWFGDTEETAMAAGPIVSSLWPTPPAQGPRQLRVQ